MSYAILIIDTHLKQFTERIQNAISDISNKPINYIINTHWHYDHVEGNETFGKHGRLITAHEHCRSRLAKDQVVPISMPQQESTSFDGLPRVTFSDSLKKNYWYVKPCLSEKHRSDLK